MVPLSRSPTALQALPDVATHAMGLVGLAPVPHCATCTADSWPNLGLATVSPCAIGLPKKLAWLLVTWLWKFPTSLPSPGPLPLQQPGISRLCPQPSCTPSGSCTHVLTLQNPGGPRDEQVLTAPEEEPGCKQWFLCHSWEQASARLPVFIYLWR